MFLNIITPCSRPNNLSKIYDSINIPPKNYRWIIVVDTGNVRTTIPKTSKNIDIFYTATKNSVYGNSQRNYGLSKVKYGHVYFNDDDTTVHPKLWENIYDLDKYDFIWFKQLWKDGSVRLLSKQVQLNNIDTHNFIASYDICKDIDWKLSKRDADGIFAEQCYKHSTNSVFIDKFLSVYNSLQ